MTEGLTNGHRRKAVARRVPKMAELVAAELRQKILRGELQPGESLTPESQLIDEYDVSAFRAQFVNQFHASDHVHRLVAQLACDLDHRASGRGV